MDSRAASQGRSPTAPPIKTDVATAATADMDEELHPLATPTLDRIATQHSSTAAAGPSGFHRSPTSSTPQGTVRVTSHAHLDPGSSSASYRGPSSPSAASSSARGDADSYDEATVQRRPHQRPDYFDLKRLLRENEVRHGELAAQAAAIKASRRASSVLGYPDDGDDLDADSVRRLGHDADTTWESRSTLGAEEQTATPGPLEQSTLASRRHGSISLTHARHASMSAAAGPSSAAWTSQASRPPSRSAMRSPPPSVAMGSSLGRPVSFFPTSLRGEEGLGIAEADAELNVAAVAPHRVKVLASLCLLGDADLERRISAQQGNSAAGVSSLSPLVRELSSALRQTLEEASTARAAEELMRKSQRSALSVLQRRHEAREGALRGVLKGMGVSDARVDRELTHADGQAEIPKIVAEKKTRAGVKGKTRPSRAASVDSRAATEDGTSALDDGDEGSDEGEEDDDDEEEALPSSLREAMSEEMIDGGAALGIPWDSTGTLLRASPRSADVELHRGRSTNSPVSARSRADDAVSTASTKAGTTKRPPRLERSASTHSAASSRSSRAPSSFAWGLWGSSSGAGRSGTATGDSSSGTGASSSGRNRKAAAVVRATTGQDAEEMDGYLSEANVAAVMSRTPSASSSASQGTPSHSPRSAKSMPVPSPASAEAEAKVNADGKQASGAIAAGLGLFGSLAWRRKKSASAQPAKHQPSLPTLPATGSMPMPKPRNKSTASSSSAASKTSTIGDGSGLQHVATVGPPDADTASAAAADDDGSGEFGAKLRHDEGERTIRGPSRPQTQHTPSGRSIGQAMHEAIGSAPSSPTLERNVSLTPPAAVPIEDLPKPPHFRAIVLATRTMTSDASSLMGEERGKRAASNVASAALQLVGTTRAQGKIIDDVPKPLHAGVRRPSSRPAGHADGSSAVGTAPAKHKRPMSMSVAASDARPSPPTPAGGSFAASATLGRALGRYAGGARKGAEASRTKIAKVEPNVTTLPDLFRFGGAASTSSRSPLASHATRLREAKGAAEGADGAAGKEMGEMGDALPPVELEPIVPDDVKSPAMALMARKRSSLTASTMGRRRSRYSNGAGATGSSGFPSVGLRALDEEDDVRRAGSLAGGDDDDEDDDTSGDEFEVYGGKGPVGMPKPPPPLSTTAALDEDPAKLLTDRYGFVYDATPADVRLLRQARKASTPAPACLTGIKVGVRARGLDSQSEDEGKDDAELVSDEEEREEAQSVTHEDTAVAALADLTSPSSEAGSLRTASSSSRKIAGPTGVPSSGAGIGIGLPVAPCKPSIEASALHVTTLAAAGHTSPMQEREFQLGGVGEGTSDEPTSTPAPPAPGTSAASNRRPPNTSATVRRLLGQLQEMHEEQQAEQQARWDDFLRRRRAAPRERVGAEKDGGGAMQSGGAAEGDDDEFGQGLVGLHRMGESKLGKEHRAEFVRLARGGIPMLYRAKVWAECSGAHEVAEPGRYRELLDDHVEDRNACTEQIDLDVHRTMPTNLFFGGEGPGVAKLRRLLVAFSWYDPACGYCQGMNNLAATLLLTHASEEEAFWVLVCIIERMLPPEYYTSNLLVAQADQRVLLDLVEELLPSLAAHLQDLGVDLPAVTFAWFLSLYTDCLPVETLFRVWDLLFVEGDVILFRVALGILALNSKELLNASSASALYGLVHSLTSRLFSVDALFKIACEDLGPSITSAKIKERRAKHVADLRVEMGMPEVPTLAMEEEGAGTGTVKASSMTSGAEGGGLSGVFAPASGFPSTALGTSTTMGGASGSSFARLPNKDEDASDLATVAASSAFAS